MPKKMPKKYHGSSSKCGKLSNLKSGLLCALDLELSKLRVDDAACKNATCRAQVSGQMANIKRIKRDISYSNGRYESIISGLIYAGYSRGRYLNNYYGKE
jgi:hypothetical protein